MGVAEDDWAQWRGHRISFALVDGGIYDAIGDTVADGSELIELRHIQTGRRFLVSYQNTRSSELGKVSDIVLDGLAAYVKATTP